MDNIASSQVSIQSACVSILADLVVGCPIRGVMKRREIAQPKRHNPLSANRPLILPIPGREVATTNAGHVRAAGDRYRRGRNDTGGKGALL